MRSLCPAWILLLLLIHVEAIPSLARAEPVPASGESPAIGERPGEGEVVPASGESPAIGERPSDAEPYRSYLADLEAELRRRLMILEREPPSAVESDLRMPRMLSELRSLERRIHHLDKDVALEILMEIDALTRAATTRQARSLPPGEVSEAGEPRGQVPPGILTGTVSDAMSGEPLPDVRITIWSRDGLRLAAAVTGPDGGYSIRISPGIRFATTTNTAGFVDELYENMECAFLLHRDCRPVSGTPIEVLPGETVSGIDFQLDRGGTIRGTLIDGDSGDPATGGPVRVLTVIGLKQKDAAVDSAGEYAVSGLPPGDYFVSTALPEYQREIYDDIQCLGPLGDARCDTSSATPVKVTAAATVSGVDFVLDRAAVIEGVVLSQDDGEPVTPVTVSLLEDDGLTVEFRVTDMAGRYSFDGLVAGTYFVATHNFFRYLDEVYDNVPCPEGPHGPDCDREAWTPVVVETGQTRRIDFLLSPLRSVSGTVRDARTGQPLAGVEVEIRDERAEIVATPKTDDVGRYRPDGLDPGVYFLSTRQELGYLDEIYQDLPCDRGIIHGCRVRRGTAVEVDLEADTTDIDFDLTFGGAIEGTLRRAATGERLVFETVSVWDRSGSLRGSGLSDLAGNYRVAPLVGGEYFVRTHSFAYVDELFDDLPCAEDCDPTRGMPVAVTVSETTPNIDFVLRRKGSLTGRVSDRDSGAPLAGFRVAVFDASLEIAGRSISGQDGRFLVEGLLPGSYFAVVTAQEEHAGEVYAGLPCSTSYVGELCNPAFGTPIEVELGRTVTGIDFHLQELTCSPRGPGVCLNQGRFQVEVAWENRFGEGGPGLGVELTGDTGYFWFFHPDNVEVVVKVLDGCFAPFDTFWVFAAGLTDLATEITVTDTLSDTVKRYRNPQGTAFLPVLDTAAFATCDSGSTPLVSGPQEEDRGRFSDPVQREEKSPLPPPAVLTGPKQGGCVTEGSQLCLDRGRFLVEAFWRTADGETGEGQAVGITEDTGYFWFFHPGNVEVVVKVLDACRLEPFLNHWFFAAGLTTVEVRLRVLDTSTGQVKEYLHRQGDPFQPVLDTAAFDTCN